MREKWQEAGVPQISKFGSEIKQTTITDTAPWTDTICKEVFEGLPDSKRDDIFSLWAYETFLLSNFLGNVILWRCWYTKDYVAVWVDPRLMCGLIYYSIVDWHHFFNIHMSSNMQFFTRYSPKNAKNWHNRCARWWNDFNLENNFDNQFWQHILTTNLD